MAATGEILPLLCLTFLAVLAVCGGSSTCYLGNSHYDVCEHGCCGTYPYEECCINLTGLIVGLVVAVVVIICIVVAVVCFVLHQKSNQVVRMVPSAHSRGDTANITILHMSSNNPYDHAPPHPPHMMTTTNAYPNPNQPSLAPPGQPTGFNNNNSHHHPPHFPPPTSKVPPTGADPAFPPTSQPPVGARPGPASSGAMMMGPAPGMPEMPPSEGSGMMPPMNGTAGMPPMNGNAGMPPLNGNAGMPPPPLNGGAGMPPMHGGPASLPMMNGGSQDDVQLSPSQITPRKVPLPSVPVASVASSPEPPRPPVVTAFGDSKGKGGAGRQREGTSLGDTGNTTAAAARSGHGC